MIMPNHMHGVVVIRRSKGDRPVALTHAAIVIREQRRGIRLRRTTCPYRQPDPL
jgi:hypothetical protein